MTIFTDTNMNRVTKIQEILGHLKKSFASNKASHDDAWKLLKPAIEDISVLVGAEAREPEQAEPAEAPAAVQAATEGVTPTQQHQMREWAKTAPIGDLTTVMAIYLNRLDEELNS